MRKNTQQMQSVSQQKPQADWVDPELQQFHTSLGFGTEASYIVDGKSSARRSATSSPSRTDRVTRLCGEPAQAAAMITHVSGATGHGLSFHPPRSRAHMGACTRSLS